MTLKQKLHLVFSTNTSIPFMTKKPSIFQPILLFCLLPIIILGCLDEIELEKATSSLDDAILVQGKLIKGESSFVIINVSNIFNFTDSPKPIQAKSVYLLNTHEEKIEIPSNTTGLHYKEFATNQTAFQIDYGIAYKVQVETFDNQMYESEFEVLYPVPTPTELKISNREFEKDDANLSISVKNLLEYTVSTPIITRIGDEQFKASLLMEFDQVFKFTDTPSTALTYCINNSFTSRFSKTCYVNQIPFQAFKLINGADLSGTEIKDFPIFQESASKFIYAEGNTFVYSQLSLSPTAFKYWSQVAENNTSSATTFDTPKGNLISNFSNITNPEQRVFGFFYASEKVIKRLYISPEFAGNPMPACPSPPLFDGSVPIECCNCLEYTNSTLEQPSWWTE